MLYSISYLHYLLAKALLYCLCHSTNVGVEQISGPADTKWHRKKSWQLLHCHSSWQNTVWRLFPSVEKVKWYTINRTCWKYCFICYCCSWLSFVLYFQCYYLVPLINGEHCHRKLLSLLRHTVHFGWDMWIPALVFCWLCDCFCNYLWIHYSTVNSYHKTIMCNRTHYFKFRIITFLATHQFAV